MDRPARFASLALVLAGLFSPPVAAQDARAGALERLEAYLDTAEYLSYVAARLNEYEAPGLRAQCPALRLVRRAQMWVVAEARFTGREIAPASGEWIDRLMVDRCGATVYRNLLVVAREQKLQASALLPGRTYTPPRLQRDALRPAAAQARIKTGCQDAMPVADTAVDGKVVPGAPWKEDWTFVGCGKSVVVTLSFTPASDGAARVTARAK
ncbi:MAG: hypothetical protein L6R19_08520 [Alphaproteobacteria bacterium]|nr:hypothetical protein [Alphaproteobacteria bacterium]